jgi:hypothetical protein
MLTIEGFGAAAPRPSALTTATRPAVTTATTAIVQAGMTPEEAAALAQKRAEDRAAAQVRAEAQAAAEAADAQAAAAEAAAAAAAAQAAATAPAPATGYPPGSIAAWSQKLGRWRVAVPATGVAGLGVADAYGTCIFGDCGLGQTYTEDTSPNVIYLTDPVTPPPGTTPVPEDDLDKATGKSKFYKKWWFWAAVGGGVAVVGGGAYYLTRKKK